LPADEVVVELDVAAVAEVPGGEVVVLDVVGGEAATDRGRALVPLGRQPLPVPAQALAGVDRRQRRRDPARLERVRRVRAAVLMAQRWSSSTPTSYSPVSAW